MTSTAERNQPFIGEINNVANSDSAPPEVDSRVFVRDGATWAGYLLYGYWSYVWAAFGAFVPFLRTQFQIDYSTAALHFSALAFGPFIAGFVGDKILRGLGMSKTIACGLSLIMFGLLSVVAGNQLLYTIGGALVIGFGGNIMSQAITTSMANRFGKFRAIGITEIQIVGSLFTLTAPLVVSLVTKMGYDWRYALTFSVIPYAVLIAASLKTIRRLGTSFTAGQVKNVKLPPLTPTYWLYFTVIFFSVASEWTVAFWSPEFLGQTFHLTKSDSAFGMSLFVTAVLIGRAAGGFVLRFVPEGRLLAGSAILAAIGFLVFWLARDLPINLIGLFILGLGEANVYPLSLSRAIGTAGNTPEKAAARISLSTGSAILLAPLCLGMLADKFGITQSYGMIAALLVVAAVAVSFAAREKRVAL
jgi:fucose permease